MSGNDFMGQDPFDFGADNLDQLQQQQQQQIQQSQQPLVHAHKDQSQLHPQQQQHQQQQQQQHWVDPFQQQLPQPHQYQESIPQGYTMDSSSLQNNTQISQAYQSPPYPQVNTQMNTGQPHTHPRPQVTAVQATAAPKKRRPQTTPSQPRKRTMMACESCRLKKVKCDLVRPMCGSCTKSGATCMYRQSSGSNGADDMTAMAGIGSKNSPLKWSSCNWYAKGEGILKWPIFEEKFKARPINTVLAARNGKRMPQFGLFSRAQAEELSYDLCRNITAYADSYIQNVSNKDPYIDVKTLLRTVSFVKKQANLHPNLFVFDLQIVEGLLPLPVLIEVCALGIMAKSLTFTNLQDYQTSVKEKENVTFLAYKFHTLSNIVNAVPLTKIQDFDLAIVQMDLLQCMFWMYNMSPLKAWDNIFKASTSVMTILESYKSSGRSFTEPEHRILERVFHSCVKYESELRVELSPSVPSSGIVNYPFPSIYPSPPLDGTLSSTEEAGWFFYLTEIVLRKLENRFLDEFYVPLVSSNNEAGPTGEFVEDNYSLDWGKFDVATIISKISVYLADLDKIEKNMVTHLKPIMQDPEAVSNELQPHGFVLKPVTATSQQQPTAPNSAILQQQQQQQQQQKVAPQQLSQGSPEDRGPLTPASDTSSSSISQHAESLAPKVPEVINFIKTRMIAFKMLLFRPLCYLILHDTVVDYDNPFIDQILTQTVETADMINIPLATHRHFGSWFYARNVFVAGTLFYGFYLRFREKFTTKDKVEKLLKNCLIIFEYWREETPDLEDPKKIVLAMLEELKNID